ncbi:hypothetical protein [Parabacteroides distasonis]|uniref:hypothetical protein n=1 Tax=Parabacteroides distasonis TaxID=823 RepID=UPI0018A0046E|nr:hypothetical protein [Parabacteroides distasonis]MDB9154237.1 hypothetical protein [Parabacteroides distasonis]MDB9158745.1 hypothetical protein [Parabacteroides distasonis]MDB9167523.1 hypothetical protein [Parabacteroides distasonis]MDB9172052.1 hypothetical protein [Parabacteroides distasonis]MDB9196639.1 hypothetical protein [Parabacteroides distasonis]
MTVGELIAELETYDKDYDVTFDTDTGDNELDDIVRVSEVYEGSMWNVVLK